MNRAGPPVATSDPLILPPIVVYGTPKGQGSHRPITTASGRQIVVEQHAKQHRTWRSEVREAARAVLEAAGVSEPLQGPLAVAIVWTWPKPKRSARIRVDGVLVPRPVFYPDTRPDTDKLERAVLDALTSAGVYKDDGQVVTVLGMKAYPGEWPWSLPAPGCTIVVRRHDALMADLLRFFTPDEDRVDYGLPDAAQVIDLEAGRGKRDTAVEQGVLDIGG